MRVFDALIAVLSCCSCLACPAGSTCQGGVSFVARCPPGSYCPPNSSTPIPCPHGRTTAAAGGAGSLDECSECAGGTVRVAGGSCAGGSGLVAGAVAIAISVRCCCKPRIMSRSCIENVHMGRFKEVYFPVKHNCSVFLLRIDALRWYSTHKTLKSKIHVTKRNVVLCTCSSSIGRMANTITACNFLNIYFSRLQLRDRRCNSHPAASPAATNSKFRGGRGS